MSAFMGQVQSSRSQTRCIREDFSEEMICKLEPEGVGESGKEFTVSKRWRRGMMKNVLVD